MTRIKKARRAQKADCNELTLSVNASFNPFQDSWVHTEYTDEHGVRRVKNSCVCKSSAEALSKLNQERSKLIAQGATEINSVLTNNSPFN